MHEALRHFNVDPTGTQAVLCSKALLDISIFTNKPRLSQSTGKFYDLSCRYFAQTILINIALAQWFR